MVKNGGKSQKKWQNYFGTLNTFSVKKMGKKIMGKESLKKIETEIDIPSTQ